MEKENEIVIRKTENVISPVPDAMNLRNHATDLINSGFFKGVNSVPQAIAKIQAGTELGFPPVQSLKSIHMIQGVMTLSAQAIMALAVSRAGVTWKVVESTDKRCELIMYRPGWEPMTVISTIEEAKKAGLVTPRSAWETYTQDMLFKTAGVKGCRRIAMDSTMGMYSTEEIQGADIISEEVPINKGVPDEQDLPIAFPQLADITLPGEEISDMAFSAEDEAAVQGQDPQIEAVIEKIKFKVVEAGCDLKKFKEWLFSYQNNLRPVRAYLGKIGKAYRFHLGRSVDLEALFSQIEPAIKKFKKEGEAI